jgi:hypothetical protein
LNLPQKGLAHCWINRHFEGIIILRTLKAGSKNANNI